MARPDRQRRQKVHYRLLNNGSRGSCENSRSHNEEDISYICRRKMWPACCGRIIVMGRSKPWKLDDLRPFFCLTPLRIYCAKATVHLV
jgi:hypothetical protein